MSRISSRICRIIEAAESSRFLNLKRLPTSLIAVGIFLFLALMMPAPGLADASINGLSGTMLIPDLEVMPLGGARAAVHMVGDTVFNEASFKGVFAFSDDSEVAVIKRFTLDGSNNQTDPVFAGKYKVRPNMAVAAVLDTNDEYKNSVMLLSGLPGNRVVLGLGTNIAMNENEKKATYGRYTVEGTTAEVDPLFFVMGASMNLDVDTTMTIDYAGNDFVIGLRHRFDERLTLDFGLYTPDRLNKKNRYIVGANFGF